MHIILHNHMEIDTTLMALACLVSIENILFERIKTQAQEKIQKRFSRSCLNNIPSGSLQSDQKINKFFFFSFFSIQIANLFANVRIPELDINNGKRNDMNEKTK